MSAPSITCRLCDTPAVGIYHMPRGCICAADPVRALCAQHIQRATPLAGMWSLLEYIEKTQIDADHCGHQWRGDSAGSEP